MFIGDMDSATSTLFGKMKLEFPGLIKEIVDEEGMITDRLLDAAMIKVGLVPHGTTHAKLNMLWQTLTKQSPAEMTMPNIGDLEAMYDIMPKPLGRGAYGMVLHARNQKQPEEDMALKLFDASSVPMIQAVRREAKLQQWLFDEHGEKRTHPNLLQYHGHFSATYKGKPYEILKLEYFSGRDLASVYRLKLPLNYKEVLDIGIAVLSALKFLHANGIAHRDIKLANIMYNADMNRTFLIDLGLACFPTNPTIVPCEKEKLGGTPLYMSPENFMLRHENDANVRAQIIYGSDVWAVGCALAILFTRMEPYWWDAINMKDLEFNLTNSKARPRYYIKQQAVMAEHEDAFPGLPALVTEMFRPLPNRITVDNALKTITCLRFPETCVQCSLPAQNRCGLCQIPYCSIECQSEDWKQGHQQACLGTLIYDASGFLIGTSHHVVIRDNVFESTGKRSGSPSKILSPETMAMLSQAIKKSLPAFHFPTKADRSPGGDMGISRFIYKGMYADPRHVPELVNAMLLIEPMLAASPGGLSTTY